MNLKYNIGLVLSGGGTRGIAHLGAIKAMEEAGVKPEIISGVSAGAIISALYASGNSPDDIFNILCEQKFMSCSKLSFGLKGLLEMRGLKCEIAKYCKETFEELEIPIYVGATDLNSGKITYFNSGNLLDAVVASSSIPVIYNPVVLNGTTYIDGGIVDNMPVSPILGKTENIIGVNVNPVNNLDRINNLFDVLSRTFQIASRSNVEGARLCNILIEPPELIKFSFLDNSKAEEVFNIGYKSAKQKIHSWLIGDNETKSKQLEPEHQNIAKLSAAC